MTELAIERVPLGRLHPAPWNPRILKDKRFRDLCKSLAADPGLLERRPILATLDGTIYAGNQRYRAAEHLGWDTVPAVLDDLSPTEAKARAIRDNNSAGEWQEDDYAALLYELGQSGVDLATLGADQKDIEALLASVGVGGAEEDAVPEPPVDPITRPGDLWLLGPHRLLCGDSTRREDVERLMAGQRAILLATDPPYAVDYQGGNHPLSGDNSPLTKDKRWSEYRDLPAAELFEPFLNVALSTALADRAAIYQWYACLRQSLVENAWLANGLLIHQQIVWVKTHPVLTRSHFMWQHEPCLYGWVRGREPERKPPASTRSVWQVDQQGESNGVHPTQKPIKLFADPISWHVPAGGLCYEPFAGSGTALIAAHQLGRVCYAMEVAPEFCDVIVQRFENLTGQTATRERAEVAV